MLPTQSAAISSTSKSRSKAIYFWTYSIRTPNRIEQPVIKINNLNDAVSLFKKGRHHKRVRMPNIPIWTHLSKYTKSKKGAEGTSGPGMTKRIIIIINHAKAGIKEKIEGLKFFLSKLRKSPVLTQNLPMWYWHYKK